MELAEDVTGLIERVERANKNLKKAKSAEERIAMANYIDNLYESIIYTTGIPLVPTEKAVFGSHKNYHKFNKKVTILDNKTLENFFENRKFHTWLFGSILDEINPYLEEYEDLGFGNGEIISKGEFFDIFLSFLNELHLGKHFDKFIENVGIYSFDSEYRTDCKGYIIYNPVNKDTDVFVGDFDYNATSLYTLAHEFGHVYEFSKFDDDVSIYNKHFYQSFYGESVSKLFERMMLEYLIKNNILRADAKDELIDMEFNNFTFMIYSYIISLLDDEMLKKHRQNIVSPEYIYSLIDEYFDEDVIDLLVENDSLEVQHNYIYAYGDVISMFLKDKVNKYGFDNDMIDELHDRRAEIFSPDFIEKYDMSPKRYVKAYQKELKLLEK